MSTFCTSKKALLGLACLVAQASAFWRLPCGAPLVVERSDPIVNPGRPSGHSHTIMGADSFNFTMDGDFTKRATCTTCKVKEDLSNYWFPNLYFQGKDGSFTPVKQTGGALVYYLQRQDKKDPEYENGLIAFPEGFRMIAGNPMLRSWTRTLEQRAINYVCLGTNSEGTNKATQSIPDVNCPAGLRSQVVFPSCWDGKNLDSPDHKSHMAYPSGMDNGYCPKTHPKRFITLFVEIVWQVDAFKGQWPSDKNPFVFSNGDPTGYGYHGDFVNGWETDVLQKAITTCTDDSGVIEYCKAFTLLPDSGMSKCNKLPHIQENVLNGPMKTLPGCNPVQSGPANAAPAAQCTAPSTIPPNPIPPFTDVLKSKQWRYMMCGLDGNNLKGRTLAGPTYSSKTTNTVDKCIDFCEGKGYRYAGVEYSYECYCGNNIKADRYPPEGSVGGCQSPCSGDDSQFCGASGRIGIYENCNKVNGSCTNMALPQW